MPPQTPYGSRTASACSRHSRTTGQVAQTALAASSRRRRAGPRSPSGWKNTSGSTRRHAPWYCHSHTTATGPGSREISAMVRSFQAGRRMNNVWRDARTLHTAPAVVQVPLTRFLWSDSTTERRPPRGRSSRVPAPDTMDPPKRRGADGRANAAWYPAVGGRVRSDGVDLHAVLQSAPLGLGVIDPSGRFVLVNDALARSMGRPASEVLGAEALGFLHPDERESARASLEQMFAGTLPGTRWERRYLRPSGSVVWARVVTAAVPERDGPPRAVVVQLQDITAERAVAEAQLELASMVSVLAEAVVTFDGAGLVRTSNRAANDLLGWSAADVLGRPFSICVPVEGMAEHRAWMARLQRGDTVREDVELLHRDGFLVSTHFTATPV